MCLFLWHSDALLAGRPWVSAGQAVRQLQQTVVPVGPLPFAVGQGERRAFVGPGHQHYKFMKMNRRKFCTTIPFLAIFPTIIEYEKFLKLVPEKIKILNEEHLRLNQTAQFLLNMCDGDKNIFQIADTYRRNFNISFNRAINDSINTLSYFNSIGIVKFR
jgi:hypothetical protein